MLTHGMLEGQEVAIISPLEVPLHCHALSLGLQCLHEQLRFERGLILSKFHATWAFAGPKFAQKHFTSRCCMMSHHDAWCIIVMIVMVS